MLHSTMGAVGRFATRGSGGQLLVYEYDFPGRSAAAAQAVHAKKAVSRRTSSGSPIARGRSPVEP